jgi:hypothetical protein
MNSRKTPIMKSRLPFLVVIIWLALSLGSCSGDHPSVAEVRTKAEQGDAKAQFNLGWRYYVGQDVPHDVAEAVKWTRRAAEQGNIDAQALLGLMYFAGQGIPNDAAEAVKWTRRAAEQGNADAQALLGWIYHEGQGVPQDDIEAYLWYSLAAAQGYEKAKSALDSIRHGITPDQIAEAQKRVVAWKPKATIDPPAKKP